MRKFFITARSFAAPFFSDSSDAYVEAETAQEALEKFAADYSHPCGLYAAEAWDSADTYHQGGDWLAAWRSNHVRAQQKATAEQGAYSLEGLGPGKFKVDGELIEVSDPKGGVVVLTEAGVDDK